MNRRQRSEDMLCFKLIKALQACNISHSSFSCWRKLALCPLASRKKMCGAGLSQPGALQEEAAALRGKLLSLRHQSPLTPLNSLLITAHFSCRASALTEVEYGSRESFRQASSTCVSILMRCHWLAANFSAHLCHFKTPCALLTSHSAPFAL